MFSSSVTYCGHLIANLAGQLFGKYSMWLIVCFSNNADKIQYIQLLCNSSSLIFHDISQAQAAVQQLLLYFYSHIFVLLLWMPWLKVTP